MTAITADTYGHVAQQTKSHALGVVASALGEWGEEAL